MRDFDALYVEETVVNSRPGVHIDTIKLQAAGLCAQRDETVVLIFNGRRLKITPNTLRLAFEDDGVEDRGV